MISSTRIFSRLKRFSKILRWWVDTKRFDSSTKLRNSSLLIALFSVEVSRDDAKELLSLVETEKDFFDASEILSNSENSSELANDVDLKELLKDLNDKYKNANPEDMNLIRVVDTEDEVLEALDTFYKKYNLSPNF